MYCIIELISWELTCRFMTFLFWYIICDFSVDISHFEITNLLIECLTLACMILFWSEPTVIESYTTAFFLVLCVASFFLVLFTLFLVLRFVSWEAFIIFHLSFFLPQIFKFVWNYACKNYITIGSANIWRYFKLTEMTW